MNSSISSFDERANSQHGSTTSIAPISASYIEAESTASTNSPSSFHVEDTATSLGKTDIINRLWKFGEIHTIVNTHFPKLVKTRRTWSTRPLQVNGITRRFRKTTRVMRPLNYLEKGFKSFKYLEVPTVSTVFYLIHRTRNMVTKAANSRWYRTRKSATIIKISSISHISAKFETRIYVRTIFHRRKNVSISCRGITNQQWCN